MDGDLGDLDGNGKFRGNRNKESERVDWRRKRERGIEGIDLGLEIDGLDEDLVIESKLNNTVGIECILYRYNI